MKLKINPLTVLLFVFAACTRNLPVLLLSYAVMAAHECAHLAAALCIGLKPESMTFAPFGVHLQLKNKIVRSLSDEIILYAAGPLLNSVLALAAVFIHNRELYRMNTAFMIMNLLPVIPLDGGIILKRILSYRMGQNAAEKLLKAVSALLSGLFLTLALLSLYQGIINLSMLIMALFLFGNLITAKELYNVDFIQAVSAGRKKTNRARLVIVDETHTMLDAARRITPSCTTIAAVLNREGEICALLPENRILEESAGGKESIVNHVLNAT